MVLGYAFPTMVSIGTLTAEYLAPKCASFRPRFGEEGCFFAGWPSIATLNVYTYTYIISDLTLHSLFNIVPLYDFLELGAKYLWFYLPMSVLLLVNSFVFIALITMLCKLDHQKRKLGLMRHKERSDLGEKYVWHKFSI